MFNEATAAAPAPVETREEITFSATGGEYFRIWIVNLLLTVVTLGIYSAWAKVRRNQYFYSSTRLAGSSFEYHGRPMAILKGRLIALALFAAYNFAFTISPGIGVLMMLVMLVVMPYLMWKSLQFKLYNASYRGIRFGFDGSVGEAYAHFLLLPLLFGTGLMAPLAHHRIKRFQHTESRYGTAHFRFDARVIQFYKAYGVLLLLIIAGMAAMGFMLSRLDSGDGRLMVFLPASLYLVLLILFPVFGAMLQNIIWNHTGLRGHDFRCEMKWGPLLWIYVTNLFGIIFTLGLYIPFARVRSMRYRLEAMAMIVDGSLDDFVAAESEQIAATGEGAADFMDLDLAL